MRTGRPLGSTRPASLLAAARIEAGLTQQDVSDSMRRYGLHTHQTQVSCWERGAYRPSEEQMAVLAKVLGLSRPEVDAMFPLIAGARQ